MEKCSSEGVGHPRYRANPPKHEATRKNCPHPKSTQFKFYQLSKQFPGYPFISLGKKKLLPLLRYRMENLHNDNIYKFLNIF